jgi:RNA polymerase sigma-70 factor, ECF subfamily
MDARISSTPTAALALSLDAALLARLRTGDDAAYAEWVRANSGRMLAVARRMLRNEDEAEDAVQEAFTQAYRALPRFEGHALLSTWLHRIVVNACLIRLRRRRRHGELSLEDLLPRFSEDGHRLDVADPWPSDPLAELEAKDVRTAVRAAIDRLPERHRCVLLLRDIEGRSGEETAECLGIRPDAVKMRLHRARQALRGLLDPQLAGRGMPCDRPSPAES